MTPIIPIVSARPCQNVREVAPQIRFSARSITANTQEPAHKTTMKQLMSTPGPTEENERIVSLQEIARTGIDVYSVSDKFSCRRDLVADGEHQKQRRKERHQSEVAHRSC